MKRECSNPPCKNLPRRTKDKYGHKRWLRTCSDRCSREAQHNSDRTPKSERAA